MNDNELIYSKVEFANMANNLQKIFQDAMKTMQSEMSFLVEERVSSIDKVREELHRYGDQLALNYEEYTKRIHQGMKDHEAKIHKYGKIQAVATLMAGRPHLTIHMAVDTIELIEEKLAERNV